MSKFLDIIEGSMPDSDIDATMKAKRDLQQFFAAKGIQSVAKTFRDEIIIHLDGSIVTIAIKAVQKIDHSANDTEEEAEDPAKTIKAISAIASLPDQGLGAQMMSSTSRKLQMAKRNMASAAEKISKDFLAAANTPG
jgi:hypothetical protein